MINRKDLSSLFKYLRPYKKTVKIAVVFVILENAAYLILPLIYGKIVDIVTQGKFFETMVFILLFLWACMELLSNWFMRIRIRKANNIACRASNDIMTKSIEHLVRLPLSFHKQQKIGEIIQRFSRADGYMYNIIDSGLFQIFPNILSSFLAFVIILWISWQLAVIYLLFISVYVWMTIKKTEPIVHCQRKINKVFEKAYGDIFDRTENIISLKSNSTEDLENKRNVENFRRGFFLNSRQVELWMKLSFWQSFIFTISFLMLFGAGIYFVSVKMVTIGQFVILLAYINAVSAAMNMLGGNYKQLQEGIVTINRSEKIFDEIPEKYDDPNAKNIENVSGNVEFKNISFSYEKEAVLKDISFKAAAGQMVAIVGRSGEGKSTLMDLISRYNIPQKGSIFLDGVNIKKIKLKSLRDQIAIVPQEVDLFNDTIKNNIAYSRISASEEEILQASKLAHCHEFIEKFPKKYEQIVGEKGVKLSTGQKQRLAIARAILRNPKILILDEATSALDSESEKYVQEALQEVMKNRTTFVIAHRLSTIRKANLILVIENGTIIESGDHEELIRHGGVYQKLSELQKISV
ncbi:MAG TPA: ABC transporter ATP-binding protein [Candidatus Moranbacteria bacterium]|nr:ABC transporter ATP-binding protein [Candidatus Moranbacteria bacterium]HSA07995.1 ABC transporter ATP-binding protein [Candidatus Moranbacteria bacterium]